jgi:hypothetical protein
MRLTLKGGGWVLVLMGVVTVGIICWAIAPAVLRLVDPAPGDGNTVESYQFDLSNLQVPQETFMPAMQHRDMSPVLTNPEILSVEELAAKNGTKRNPFLVNSDLVVGITIGDETRAYPLHVLNVHEVVNDTIGGVPLTVYWNWPSGHIAVFQRVIDRKEIQFGITGLAGNGSMLLYEKGEEEGGEQLYSAILGHSVSGDVVQLKQIPHEVTSWNSWFSRHPNTKSIAPVEGYKKRYRKGDPRTYFLNETIYFPVSPMPKDSANPKTAVIALQTTDGHAVYEIQSLLDAANDQGELKLQVDGKPVTFIVGSAPLFAIAQDENGNAIPTQRALWFTWYANHPDAVLVSSIPQQ